MEQKQGLTPAVDLVVVVDAVDAHPSVPGGRRVSEGPRFHDRCTLLPVCGRVDGERTAHACEVPGRAGSYPLLPPPGSTAFIGCGGRWAGDPGSVRQGRPERHRRAGELRLSGTQAGPGDPVRMGRGQGHRRRDAGGARGERPPPRHRPSQRMGGVMTTHLAESDEPSESCCAPQLRDRSNQPPAGLGLSWLPDRAR